MRAETMHKFVLRGVKKRRNPKDTHPSKLRCFKFLVL